MRNKHQILSGVTAALLFVFGVIQIVMGELVTQSVALTANGIDCLGDGIVSIIVWAGLKFSGKPSDNKFHFGYYRVENLASILAAVMMLILGSYIALKSYNQFLHPHAGEMPILGAIVALLASITALSIGIYKYIDSRKSNREAIKMEAFNTIKDGMSSLLTVIALILYGMGYVVADAAAGAIISIIIFGIGFSAIKEASLTLADACNGACVDQKLLISNILQNICSKEIKAGHDIRLRRSGPITHGEMIIEVPGNFSLNEVQKIKDKIYKELKEKVPDVEPLTIIAVPIKEN